MNASVSRFRGTRRNRAPRPARMGVFAVLAATLAMGVIVTPSEAYLIRIDGDYLYMTEDFESVEGPMTPGGTGVIWGNGFAVEIDDLWHGFAHEIGYGYGDLPENLWAFPYLVPGYSELKFALVDNENRPNRDGMALLLRRGYHDVITFPNDPENPILEFSCDAFLLDVWHGYYDSHAIDLIGTEGRMRYFLSMHEMSQHVVIAREEFSGLIGDLQSVRLESSWACFDNITIKTLSGQPSIPEPGLATLAMGLAAVFAFRRRART